MIETNLNMFDTTVFIIMALSCLIAFFRGLVREILSLIAWVGAAIVAMYYFAPAMEKMKPHFANEAMAAGATAIGLYIGALFCFSLVNWMLIKVIKQGGEAGMLDNMLGLGFGALRGAFIVSLGFFMLTMVLPEKETPAWLADSITRPYVEKGATLLASASPEYLRDISALREKAENYATSRREHMEAAEDSYEQMTDDSEQAQ